MDYGMVPKGIGEGKGLCFIVVPKTRMQQFKPTAIDGFRQDLEFPQIAHMI